MLNTVNCALCVCVCVCVCMCVCVCVCVCVCADSEAEVPSDVTVLLEGEKLEDQPGSSAVRTRIIPNNKRSDEHALSVSYVL